MNLLDLNKQKQSQKKLVLQILIFGVLLFLPVFLGITSLYFLMGVYIFVIYALSFDMALGYTGMLPLTHSAFLGFGGYIFYYALSFLNSPLLGFLISFFAVFALAWGIGKIATRQEELGFVIVTVVVSLAFWRLADSHLLVSVTGGSDGFNLSLSEIGLFFGRISLTGTANRYYVILIVSVISFLIIRHILKSSTIGLIFEGIRENEKRMKIMGYDTNFYKVLSYSISGAFAGLCGALLLFQLEFISSSFFQLIYTFRPIMYTILGGVGTFYGPILGAITVVFLKYYVSMYIDLYQMIPAALMVVVVMFYPKGLYGFAKLIVEKTREFIQV